MRRKISDGVWESYSLEQMMSLNEILYSDILEGNYSRSYANPAYAVRMLREDYGRLLSFLAAEVRGIVAYAMRTAFLI
mgnify:CR=1 FL=1